ncbi:MAG: NADH-quinone oxidoreductase subunit NuoN [Pseudomonadota bacterium]
MEALMPVLTEYAPLLPEITLVLGIVVLEILGLFRKNAEELVCWLAILLLAIAGVLFAYQGDIEKSLFQNAYIADPFGRFMKLLVIISSIFVILLSMDYMKKAGLLIFEYPILILMATLGMMIMISANDLISLYLGLELQSLSLYIIAAMHRDSVRSSEAGLKYFVLGALSSGMLLYGASFIYGVTGSTQFPEIASALQGSDVQLQLVFGIVFLLAGFAFKISAVPFHMWTPDVYEGSPTPVTAFFAAAPKIAAMALLMRTTLGAFPSITTEWQQIIIFLSIASMLWGAFAAIGQNNIKRLLAYSSIGHMGFALVGLASGSAEGATSVIIYMSIYMAMTLGTFACVLSMRCNGAMVEDIKDLSGLAQTNLPMAFLLAMLMFSLAGIPPLAGFFAKFYVFSAAIKAGLYPLAVIGVLASVVAAYYYLRIVILMFVEEPADGFEPMPSLPKFVLGLSGIFVLGYVVYPAPLREAAQVAAQALPAF